MLTPFCLPLVGNTVLLLPHSRQLVILLNVVIENGQKNGLTHSLSPFSASLPSVSKVLSVQSQNGCVRLKEELVKHVLQLPALWFCSWLWCSLKGCVACQPQRLSFSYSAKLSSLHIVPGHCRFPKHGFLVCCHPIVPVQLENLILDTVPHSMRRCTSLGEPLPDLCNICFLNRLCCDSNTLAVIIIFGNSQC